MFEKWIRYLVARAGKEYSTGYRAVATVLGATLFIAGWPTLVWVFSFGGREAVFPSLAAVLLSGLFFVAGIPWVSWAVLWQLLKGRGTPVPVVPTKEFLSSGPYRYCRNPMILGFFLYLAGWAALFNRAGSWAAAIVLMVLLILEIKLIEEKELEQRFGDVYREYKKKTPFFISKFQSPKLPG
ncbi:MAG: isoprenylcysteine carboxylmethyltransferase family protein [Candidatus Omnitrophota bacterium]|jgi:protein-S-isoprenylcysteine O-methyltransferase Ste14